MPRLPVSAVPSVLLILLGMFSVTKCFVARWVPVSGRCRPMCTTSLPAFEGFLQPDSKEDARLHAMKFNTHFPCIILVNPALDQNVGSVARCMLNYGLTELRVVQPGCNIRSDFAQALSSGAHDILLNAQVFSSLDECIADLTSVMATSDRTRHMAQLVYSPEKAAQVALSKKALDAGSKIGIMFGTERTGLTNEEMAKADVLISIPTFSHFSSLNLAQAVNIIGYEIWKEFNNERSQKMPDEWLHVVAFDRLASRADVENFCDRLEQQLRLRNFQEDPVRQKQMYSYIRGIIQRMKLSHQETKVLHGILTNLIRPPPSESNSNQQM